MVQAQDAGTIKKFKETLEGNLSTATTTFACLRDEFYPKQDAWTMAAKKPAAVSDDRRLTRGRGSEKGRTGYAPFLFMAESQLLSQIRALMYSISVE